MPAPQQTPRQRLRFLLDQGEGRTLVLRQGRRVAVLKQQTFAAITQAQQASQRAHAGVRRASRALARSHER